MGKLNQYFPLRFVAKRTIMDVVYVTGLWLQVDASRRQNDPRKPAKAPASIVRPRSKPGQAPSGTILRERVVERGTDER